MHAEDACCFLCMGGRGLCVLGLTLNVAALSLCIRGVLTQWTTLLYILSQSSAWEL